MCTAHTARKTKISGKKWNSQSQQLYSRVWSGVHLRSKYHGGMAVGWFFILADVYPRFVVEKHSYSFGKKGEKRTHYLKQIYRLNRVVLWVSAVPSYRKRAKVTCELLDSCTQNWLCFLYLKYNACRMISLAVCFIIFKISPWDNIGQCFMARNLQNGGKTWRSSKFGKFMRP